MNKIVSIQFTPWDKVYYFDSNNIDLKKGDKVVVKTEMGMEVGSVVGFLDSSETSGCQCPNKDDCAHKDKSASQSTVSVSDQKDAVCPKVNGDQQVDKKERKPILRIADSVDLKKIPSEKEKEKALDYCKRLTEKYKLPMKLIDVHFSFEGSRMTFAFIADSRVDFRDLVKDLTRHFNASIRLQQIGIRDEARMMGDFGHCGKPLCCRGHLKNLESITSDMAELQQCAHRGSERISGMCGRLMCCLAYEQKGYKELEEKMPPIGAKVNVDGKRGEVVRHHILKQTVDVKFRGEKKDEGSTIVEIDLNRNK